MNVKIGLAMLFGEGLWAAASPALAAPPARVGTCAYSRITWVGQRVGPNTGSAVRLRNGVNGVSYDQIAPVNLSRVGDRVFTCLISIPRNCPPGDVRGRIYTTTNLRRMESWTLPDSPHFCGGA
jgi:hypothetical protein